MDSNVDMSAPHLSYGYKIGRMFHHCSYCTLKLRQIDGSKKRRLGMEMSLRAEQQFD